MERKYSRKGYHAGIVHARGEWNLTDHRPLPRTHKKMLEHKGYCHELIRLQRQEITRLESERTRQAARTQGLLDALREAVFGFARIASADWDIHQARLAAEAEDSRLRKALAQFGDEGK